MSSYLNGLNPPQREAAEHFEGPLLVLAGAGSGKTRVLTARIAHLIEEYGVDPRAILALTFTNKAAGEMRERLRRLIDREPAGMWVGTFHAIGARMLRRHASRLGWTPSFVIYDADDSESLIRRIAKDQLSLDPNRWNPRAMRAAISSAKNELMGVENYARHAFDEFSRHVAQVYERYQAALREANAFDFDDLLIKPVELLRSNPGVLGHYRDRFQFVLVDEYQDTNHAQYVFLQLLAAFEPGPGATEVPAKSGTGGGGAAAATAGDARGGRGNRSPAEEAAGGAGPRGGGNRSPAEEAAGGAGPRGGGNLFVVGDDDQSIYGWRGADIRNILDFEKDFPGARLVRLEQNYRSTQHILEAANRVIAKNLQRKGKTLHTANDAGERLTLVESADEADEAEWIAREIRGRLAADAELGPRDFVVLYRTNAQSRALEEALRREALPYRIVGGTRFYERREVKDVLAYLRLVANPAADEAFLRIVNVPRRGIGDTSVARLAEWATAQKLTLLAAAAKAEEIAGIRGGAERALPALAAMIETYAALVNRGIDLGEVLQQLVLESGLVEMLREEGPEGEDRVENLDELIAGAAELQARLEADDPELLAELEASGDAAPRAIDHFLAHVALVADIDQHDLSADVVSLMTIHNAKGLEFPLVFVAGMEDGLFPLSRAYDEPDQLEEERRLFYVGITRAECKLYLTLARRRRRGAEWVDTAPSSFLEAIPGELLELRQAPGLEAQQAGSRPWRRPASSLLSRRSSRLGLEPAPDSSRYLVDYSDSQDAPRLIKGARVRHPQFGAGTVIELAGAGADVRATIDFDVAGRKRVVVRYANLQSEWE